MVVFLVIFVVLYLMMAGLPILAVLAYRSGQWTAFGVCIAMLVVAMAATLYFSVPRWGGKLIERLNDRMYASEGTVRLALPQTERRKRIGKVLAVAFGTCILASVVLLPLCGNPDKYMQPISVIYCVPFMVGIWLLQRPASSPLMLLWPALYVLHAILIVAGAPIIFSGFWSSLNMLIPVAGYGLLAGLVSHAYSRFALRKLRQSAGECGEESGQEPRP
jgi:hypothetical protein